MQLLISRGLSGLALCLLLISASFSAQAYNEQQRDSAKRAVRLFSYFSLPEAAFQDLFANPPHYVRELKESEEVLIMAADKEFEREQKTGSIRVIGRPLIAGLYQVSSFDTGTQTSVSFQFFDPTTSQPVLDVCGGSTTTAPVVPCHPPVSSVAYSINTDPRIDFFSTLGASSDAASNFALPFTVTGFEPMIRATPLDSAGRPIFIAGFDGTNVASGTVVNVSFDVPEPPAWPLIAVGFAVIAFVRRTASARATEANLLAA